MRLLVDRNLCEANAICVGMAPDVFEIDDDDELVLVDDNVPESRLSELTQIALVCPVGALSITDD